MYILDSSHVSISWVDGYAGTIDLTNQTYVSVGADSKFEGKREREKTG